VSVYQIFTSVWEAPPVFIARCIPVFERHLKYQFGCIPVRVRALQLYQQYGPDLPKSQFYYTSLASSFAACSFKDIYKYNRID